MADVTVREPCAQDIAFVAKNLRQRDQIEFKASTFDAASAATATASINGAKRCVYVDGVPVFIGGFIPTGPGIVQAWGFGTASADKYMLTITKEAKKMLKALTQRGGVKRVQAQALSGQSAAWLKFLGLDNFQPIGRMNGQAFVYAWREFQ